MRKDKRETSQRKRSASASSKQPGGWTRFWPALTLAVVAWLAYLPALSGPFLFDDLYLPFADPPTASLPLLGWLRGARPVTMFSYWVNYRLSGLDPHPYHATNLIFHLLASGMVYLALHKLLSRAGAPKTSSRLLAIFSAGLFLLHPVQTEAVSYIASRSENLSVFLGLAALAIFLLNNSESITWLRTLGIAALLGLGVLAKEHVVAIVAVILLADCLFRPQPASILAPLKRNWRLYSLLAVTGAAAALLIARVMRTSLSAGFGLKDLSWSDYLFTQFRVVWVYLRLFVAPYSQVADYVFPVSRSAGDLLALAGLGGLALVSGVAIWKRKKYPLAVFGWFAFLILLAPTSSIVPIKDPIAERRLYLPFIGLLCILADFLWRTKLTRSTLTFALSALLAVASFLTWQRNHVWASSVALWEDSVRKAPENWRAHFQLAFAYFQTGRCQEAVNEYGEAARRQPQDATIFVNWALAYSCLNQDAQAIRKLEVSARIEPTAHVYSQIGMIYGKLRRQEEALAALEKARSLDPNFDATYLYLGHLATQSRDYAAAGENYRKAVALNPMNDAARRALAAVESATPAPAPK